MIGEKQAAYDERTYRVAAPEKCRTTRGEFSAKGQLCALLPYRPIVLNPRLRTTIHHVEAAAAAGVDCPRTVLLSLCSARPLGQLGLRGL
jgi:hypothetical protein